MEKVKKGVRLDHISKIYQDPKTGKDFYAVKDTSLTIEPGSFVTLPLIKDSFLSGLVTAFVRSITAISAIILLVTPQFLLITVQINEFAEKGSYSLACAFATILIVITYGAVLLMNLFMKYFGTSRKLKEDN